MAKPAWKQKFTQSINCVSSVYNSYRKPAGPKQPKARPRKNPDKPTLRTMPYAEYLLTQHWQHLRELVPKRALRRCQLCGSPDRLDVHHNNYERRGDERLSDLIALCRSCHSRFHGVQPAAKRA